MTLKDYRIKGVKMLVQPAWSSAYQELTAARQCRSYSSSVNHSLIPKGSTLETYSPTVYFTQMSLSGHETLLVTSEQLSPIRCHPNLLYLNYQNPRNDRWQLSFLLGYTLGKIMVGKCPGSPDQDSYIHPTEIGKGGLDRDQPVVFSPFLFKICCPKPIHFSGLKLSHTQ